MPDLNKRTLRAITLWPEWAWGVGYLGKPIENRSWPAPLSAKGEPLAIHGGLQVGGARKSDLQGRLEAVGDLKATAVYAGAELPSCTDLELLRRIEEQGRGIVAVARSMDGVCPQTHNPVGWYAGGMKWGWKLGAVVTLARPVPAKGKQGLWELDADVLEAVVYALPTPNLRRELAPRFGYVIPEYEVGGLLVEVEVEPNRWEGPYSIVDRTTVTIGSGGVDREGYRVYDEGRGKHVTSRSFTAAEVRRCGLPA